MTKNKVSILGIILFESDTLILSGLIKEYWILSAIKSPQRTHCLLRIEYNSSSFSCMFSFFIG